jgi:hypothetical protein
MFKMGSYCSFGHLKQVMGKRRVRSQPDLLKAGNQPDLLISKGRATYRWKALNESYNFV